VSSAAPSSSLGTQVSESALGRIDDRPLTDAEQKLLSRLLSDPFSIPITFKTWMVSYLESSDMTLPISSIQGLSAKLPKTSVAGAHAPSIEIINNP
jgi:hypothetical protein